jgi:hypothetical protein
MRHRDADSVTRQGETLGDLARVIFKKKEVAAVKEIERERSRHVVLLIVIELFDRQAAGIEQVENRLIDHFGKPQQQRGVNLQGALPTLY